METEQQRIVERAHDAADADLEDRVTDLEDVERHRDAGDGRFVTAEDAAARPAETIAESASHPTRREVAAAHALLAAALQRHARLEVRRYRTMQEEHVARDDRLEDLAAAMHAALKLLE